LKSSTLVEGEANQPGLKVGPSQFMLNLWGRLGSKVEMSCIGSKIKQTQLGFKDRVQFALK